MLNKIFIMGRLTRDPELRRTQSGTPVTSFSLAVDRDYKTQSGEKETDFIDVVAWRATAEFVAKYFTKGCMVVHVAAIHCLEDSIEVSLLIWEELGKSLLTTLYRVCQNHLTHGNDLLIIEEHVLCTCQTDTLGTECTGYLSIVWSIRIGTDFHLCIFVAEIHQLLEVA